MKNWKIIFRRSFIFGLILILVASAGYFLYSKSPLIPHKTSLISLSNNNNDVLGRYSQAPGIFIYGDNQQYVSGGMIALASTDDPSIEIGGYNISGTAQVSMYKADINSLLGYLTHDKDGKQTTKTVDTSKFEYVTKVSQDINTSGNNSVKVSLPFTETGIWFLNVQIGNTQANAYVLRSNIGALTDEANNQFIFWGQNYKTKRSIGSGNLSILNLQDKISTLQTTTFGSDGLAYGTISSDADIALIEQGGDYAIIPINLKYLNNEGGNYKEFQPAKLQTKYFVFTDRPLYKPGDTVYFKAVLRDDDDARYTIPAGKSVTAKVFDGSYYGGDEQKPISQSVYTVSSDGTITGQYKIPSKANVGYYTLELSDPNDVNKWSYYASSYFDVEYYQKPEFSIDITTPKTEVISGDKIDLTISGNYFSGQPLANQTVKYSVTSSDFFEYSYLSDQQYFSNELSDTYKYGYWYGSGKVTEGTVTLDKDGKANLQVDSKVDFNKGKSQVFSIEATLNNGAVTPSFARKNVLVYAGEYGTYRTDSSYGSKLGSKVSIPVKLVAYKTANVSGIDLTAKIHRVNWVAEQDQNKKYPSYKKEEEDLPNATATTNNKGEATISFTPTKVGSYTITVDSKDSRGNLISKEFYSWVSAEDFSYSLDSNQTGITLTLDKQRYTPTETAHINIFSTTPDRDVFFALERGRVERYQIVHLNGKTGAIDIPLTASDMPNVYAAGYSFSSHSLDSTSVNLPVSTEGKKLLVNITPNNNKYAPGDTATVNISTTDYAGNPVAADVALWTVDKAIFELTDNNLGDIFKTFWSERYNSTSMAHSLEGIVTTQTEMGGGCFASGTKILMGNMTSKNIEDVKTGDYVITRSDKSGKLIKAKVTSTTSADDDGYLIINGSLKITPDHILKVNNNWQEASNIQKGDRLVSYDGQDVVVESIEWQLGKTKVYNLEVEKYHTFFANGVWVHNQKGDSRSNFKDTAYWNPTIHTDQNGRAQVSFKLPDNMTTWIIAAVGDTNDTKVGQTTKEITVTKDLIVRPILPNILRLNDTTMISALVQNSTSQDQSFNISLKFDSGEIEKETFENISIKANSMQEESWKIMPTKETDKAKLIFTAKSTSNNKLTDSIEQTLPVRPFGFMEKSVTTGEDDKTFQIKLSQDDNKDKSSVTLSLSPTITGTLPLAMKYLVEYPYGCVEQTTSRFAPTLIAKANSQLFTGALKDRDTQEIIESSIKKLTAQQSSDGGWPWWYSGQSDTYITAYVVEYLVQARNMGVTFDDQILQKAQTFLEKDTYYDYQTKQNTNYGREERIVKNYGLAMLGDVSKIKKVTDFTNLTPDLLALNVVTNYLVGDQNPETSGYNTLKSLAQTQGDAVYWNGGDKLHFGSKDASTALALRAILFVDKNSDLTTKAARFLTRNRQYDYWSNTYATTQVVQALTDYTKKVSGVSPNYSYTVLLDNKQIAQGKVNSLTQSIDDIKVPLNSIKTDGSTISITKTGDGKLYSTLAVNEYHTDKNYPSLNHGLNVKREYVNEKGAEYTPAIGDTIDVKITVSGLNTDEYYGVINDELPAGMVPVNESFKNEQYGQNQYNNYYDSYSITDSDITENGVILSIYKMGAGERTYTYRARVVSGGTFTIPPAIASLMYAPEIFGRTGIETIQIGSESQLIPGKTLQKIVSSKIWLIVGAVVAVMASLTLVILKKKGIFKKKNSPPVAKPPENPPTDNVSPPTNIVPPVPQQPVPPVV